MDQAFDVAGRDERNRSLGQAGEERVLHHERAILTNAGRQDLARKVRRVSQEDGDGAGYDISSFTPEGKSRLIEVKTTNGWERTPFHVSRNELAAADENRDSWTLFRLWNFSREPRAFEFRPPLDAHVELAATSFQASSCKEHPTDSSSIAAGRTIAIAAPPGSHPTRVSHFPCQIPISCPSSDRENVYVFKRDIGVRLFRP